MLHQDVASGRLSGIVRVEIATVIGDVEDAGEQARVLDGEGHIGCPHTPHDVGHLIAGEADLVAVREDPVKDLRREERSVDVFVLGEEQYIM